MNERWKDRCEDCKFYLPHYFNEKGACRRYPPPASPTGMYYGAHPLVREGDSCGEFKPKEE